jgi:hypothetical protein
MLYTAVLEPVTTIILLLLPPERALELGSSFLSEVDLVIFLHTHGVPSEAASGRRLHMFHTKYHI